MEMGKNIRALRERQGLTQAQVADRINVDASSIAKWETGASKPLRKYHQPLCEALDCTMAQLTTTT